MDEKLVERLCSLAALSLESEAQTAKLKTDLLRTICFIEKIQRVDTNGIEPLVSLSEFRYNILFLSIYLFAYIYLK